MTQKSLKICVECVCVDVWVQAEESKKRSEKLVDNLRAILEETDLRIAGQGGHRYSHSCFRFCVCTVCPIPSPTTHGQVFKKPNQSMGAEEGGILNIHAPC